MSGRQHKQRRARERKDYVQRFMATYIVELRQILGRAWPAYARRHPDTRGPCHSCAFNPGTDTWPGFEQTALGLMTAIRQDRKFYCHEHLSRKANGDWYWDPSLPTPAPCRGWEAIAAQPETKRAASVAVKRLGPVPLGVIEDSGHPSTCAAPRQVANVSYPTWPTGSKASRNPNAATDGPGARSPAITQDR